MPAKKEVKKLSKDLVLAIEWAAAEYKYLKELQEQLAEIEKGKKPLQKLRKAVKMVHYISRAERRANQFEERANKGIEELKEELSKQLGADFVLGDFVKAIREITKELNIERAHLVNYTSFYDGLLEKELNKVSAEEKLEEEIKKDNPKKVEQIHSAVLQFVNQIKVQVKDAQQWVSALEGSLQKAQKIIKKYHEQHPRAEKDLIAEGLEILRENGWNLPDSDVITIFFAQHPDDLRKLAKTAGNKRKDLFSAELPKIYADLLSPKIITWDQMVSGLLAMMKKLGPNKAIIVFHYFHNDKFFYGDVGYNLGTTLLIKRLFFTKEPIITWEQFVEDIIEMTNSLSLEGTRILFEYCFDSNTHIDKYITKQNWPFFKKLFPRLAGVIEERRGIPSALHKGVSYLMNVTFSLYSSNPELPEKAALLIGQKLLKSDIYLWFGDEEVRLLVKFMKSLVKSADGMDIVYSIDRSGRILGILFYHVLRNLGLLKGIKFYFISATREGKVTFYSEQQKKEIVGKNILLIDDYISSGTTIQSTMNELRRLGAASVTARAFSTGYFADQHSFGTVSTVTPSWFGQTSYSGLNEKPQGGVEVEKYAQVRAREVRKSLIKFAEFIVEYLRYERPRETY
ncbi:MAG: phosphoribosyltransferase [Nanoarchaeota archaeon]